VIGRRNERRSPRLDEIEQRAREMARPEYVLDDLKTDHDGKPTELRNQIVIAAAQFKVNVRMMTRSVLDAAMRRIDAGDIESKGMQMRGESAIATAEIKYACPSTELQVRKLLLQSRPKVLACTRCLRPLEAVAGTFTHG